MKALFPGSYSPTEEDFALLWSEGMFVFDTSMLLNFHRYSEETRQTFLNIVSSAERASRIWIPYQVALEYHNNIDRVRYEQVAACIKMRNAVRDWSKSLRAGDHRRRAGQLLELTDKLVADAEEQYVHPVRQALVERIAELLDGKVGPEWTDKRLQETYKDGERRYAQKIPPGFQDASQKKGDERFGDLVIWFQIIEEAEKRKKPVILITDDLKEDWWLDIGGRTLGPLPSLRNEIFRRAGVLFYMYSGDRFLEQALLSLKRPVQDSAVAEAKEVRVQQQRKRNFLADTILSRLNNYRLESPSAEEQSRFKIIRVGPVSPVHGKSDEYRIQFRVRGPQGMFALSRSGSRAEMDAFSIVLHDALHAQRELAVRSAIEERQTDGEDDAGGTTG